MHPELPMRRMEMELAKLEKFTRSRLWKEKLGSGRGLFAISRQKPPPYIKDPSLSGNSISGDLLSMETIFFNQAATPSQIEFFDDIKQVNPAASIEYMLTVSGTLPIWRHDIIVLEHILNVLTGGERFLENEEKIIRSASNLNQEKSLFEVLEKHLPHLIIGIPQASLSLQDELQAIPQLEKKIQNILSELKRYLNQKRAELPFLFEYAED